MDISVGCAKMALLNTLNPNTHKHARIRANLVGSYHINDLLTRLSFTPYHMITFELIAKNYSLKYIPRSALI